MPSRYVQGPVYWRESGDKALTQRMRARARVYLGLLFERVARYPEGWGSAKQTWPHRDGSITAQVWIDRAGVKKAVVAIAAGTPAEGTDLLMEHGWLTSEVVDETTVFTVSTWGALANYYAAGGLVQLAVRSYQDGSREFAIRPDLDGEGSYVSKIPGRGDRSADAPHRYSGLTRLLVQALTGANRRLSDLLDDIQQSAPEAVAEAFSSADPVDTTIGCIRSPDGVYWLVGGGFDATPETLEETPATFGLYAVQLAIPAELRELADAAQAGLLTGLDRQLADAFALGYCTIAKADGVPVWVELFGKADADWLAVYRSTTMELEAPNTRLATDHFRAGFWGWCWRYQARGASDEHTAGAVIVTRHRYVTDYDIGDPIIARVATLEIAWADAVPSATISVTDDAAFSWVRDLPWTFDLFLSTGEDIVVPGWAVPYRLAYDHPTSAVWLSDGYNLAPLGWQGVGGFLDDGSEHVLAAWYGQDGGLHTIKVQQTGPAEITNTLDENGFGQAITTRPPLGYSVDGAGYLPEPYYDFYERLETPEAEGCASPVLPVATVTEIHESPYLQTLIISDSPGIASLVYGKRYRVEGWQVEGFNTATQQPENCAGAVVENASSWGESPSLVTSHDGLQELDGDIAVAMNDATMQPTSWGSSGAFYIAAYTYLMPNRPAYGLDGVITGRPLPDGLSEDAAGDFNGIWIGGA